MRLLVAMASPEYVRYYDSTIRLLAARGHEVVVAVNHDRGDKKPVKLDGLGGGSDGAVSVLGVLPAATAFWRRFSTGLRGTMDFVRYYDPELAAATALRQRIKRKVLPRPLHILDRVPRLSRGATQALIRCLATVERAIPTVRALDDLLARLRPDAVLVSPLVDAASPQVDLIKSAQRLGIPAAAGIASWDNLTNKGVLRIVPDVVLVWNDIQKREAITLHGVPAERIAVTGAQPFDRWFDRRTSQAADAFCRMVGLPDARSFVLFTCSSGFIAEGASEVAFVRRWIQAVRTSGNPQVAALPILVRPHPYNTRAWVEADFSDLRDVAVWPRGPYNPVAEDARAAFFDSLYHSAAVVGINTSAMIEAAIVGRPVLSIRTADFAPTQEGTLHFHYLLPEHGGFLRVAGTLQEHVAQLADVVAQPEQAHAETRRFVNTFIRPRGVESAATPAVVDALEALAARPVARQGAGAAVLLRPVVWIAAVLVAAAAAASADSWRRTRKAARMRWHRARKRMARLTGATAAGR